MKLIPLRRLLAQLARLLMQQLERILLCNLLTLRSLNVMPSPLPQLRPRYFGSSSVFHEIVDGYTAHAADPGFHVAQADVEVLADAGFGYLAGNVHVEEVAGGDVDVFAADVHLVGCRHVLVEDFGCNGCESWVGYPCAIVASARFAELVRAHLCHGGVVGLLVVLDRNLGCHATHGVNASPVACLDEELDVGVHEGRGHSDGVAVGEDEVRVLTETLDGIEDVVPAAAVETSGVVAQLVDDLLLSQYDINCTLWL
jgi:hypothetical protein